MLRVSPPAGLLAGCCFLLAACADFEPPDSAPAVPASGLPRAVQAAPAPAAELVRPAEDAPLELAAARPAEELGYPQPAPEPAPGASPSAAPPADAAARARREGQPRGEPGRDDPKGGMNRVPAAGGRADPRVATGAKAGLVPELPAQDEFADTSRRRGRQP